VSYPIFPIRSFPFSVCLSRLEVAHQIQQRRPSSSFYCLQSALVQSESMLYWSVLSCREIQ